MLQARWLGKLLFGEACQEVAGEEEVEAGDGDGRRRGVWCNQVPDVVIGLPNDLVQMVPGSVEGDSAHVGHDVPCVLD